MAREPFEDALARGRRAEKLVAAWMMRRGFVVLPVYDYSGLSENKAPKLVALPASASLVMPDLMVARGGASRLVEVKWKKAATWTHSTQRWETGLALPLWRYYEQVERITGMETWVVFAHECEDEVRGGSLATLRPKLRVYEGWEMGRGGMAFFPWDGLVHVAVFSEIARLGASAAVLGGG